MNEERMNIITAPDGAKYLGDWMKEIPIGVLKKGMTGCGATSLAIEQPSNTILTVPFTGLIDNKVAQYPKEECPYELLGVYGAGNKEQEIKNYLERCEDRCHPYKIATTYDSLPKVVRILEKSGLNPFTDSHLTIDEWHLLFNSYDFRYEAIRGVLDLAPKFDKATWISATPVERKYFLTEMLHLPETEIKWPQAMETTIQTYQYTNPLDCMAVMCVDKVTLGIDDSNYHIFINSVEDISYIIRRAKLTPENTRVICADKPENLRKLPKGFGISKTLDPVKPISLYTATCFEGQDIYDGYGRTFIVSNGNKNHTLLDVRTSIIQISGRVRQSKYDHRIIHLYSTSKYGDITLEEFEESTEANFKKAVEHADRLNRNNTTEDRATLNSDNVYVRKLADNTFEADRNRANYELVNFKIENNIYKSYTNVIDELERSGLKITDKGFGEAPTEKLDAIVKSRYTFKDCFNDYCKLRESCSVSLDYEWQLSIMEKKYPFVRQAYDILGKDKVQKMKYHQSNIKREIGKHITPANEMQLVRKINEHYPPHQAIPITEVKERLQAIYDWLGIDRTAKSTDLNQWYETKTMTKSIKGKDTACIAIIRQKMVIVKDEK